MSKLRLGISLSLIFLVLSINLPVSAASVTAIRLSPSYVEANLGDQFTIDLRVENVTALNNLDIRLNYPADALEVQDMDPVQLGTQIAPRSFLPADQICANSAENGVIRYCASLLSPHTPVSGSGVVAQITFKAKVQGTYMITLDRSQSFLYQQNDPTPITIDQWSDATIVMPKRPIVINGSIKRQGAAAADRSALWALFMIDSNQFRTTPDLPIATNTLGQFTVTIPDNAIALTPNSAALSARSGFFPLPTCVASWWPYPPYRAVFLQASFKNYLSTAGWVCLYDKTTNLGNVTLVGGDVNGDEIINIQDVVLTLNHWNESVTAPCAITSPYFTNSLSAAPIGDVNGDCRVDISDLSIITGNFGRHGPVNWSSSQ